jgi:LDH2 family malate/lactate/ureidoglycolate dehydrogenase
LEGFVRISVDDLKKTTLRALQKNGYPESEASIILDVLMYAQMRGNNQGVVKLVGAGMPRDAKAYAMTILKDSAVSALIDGGRNQAMLAMKWATELAIEKAKSTGLSIVGTNNTFTSTGAIGYFAGLIAEAGLIGIVASGSAEYVAMHGSYEPIFGTNPFAIGVPANEGNPIVFDMATSAIARFGIIEAKTAGRSLPDGVAYDKQGAPTNDPAAALEGAIRTFGGYKGAALSLIVDLMTHQLLLTSRTAEGRKQDSGNLVLVIDPDLMLDRETFAASVASYVERIKRTRRLPGVDEILVPGERGNRVLNEIMATGQIEIEDALWAALQKVADS